MARVLKPIRKLSVADAVYEQLRDGILTGRIEAGTELPGERTLSEMFEVNRGAVREGLKRLEQGRLISIQQGGATRVLDFRSSATLELVSQLLITPSGRLDLDVARSVIELRAAITPDIARLAALRGGAELSGQLDELVDAMRTARDDVARIAALSEEVWEVLVTASGNVAYRLIFNTVGEVHHRYKSLLDGVLEPLYRDTSTLEAIVEAVKRGDPDEAAGCAQRHADPISQSLHSEIQRGRDPSGAAG